eukprot:403356022
MMQQSYQESNNQNMYSSDPAGTDNSFQRGISLDTSMAKSYKQGSMNQREQGANETCKINVIVRIRPCTNAYQQNQSLIGNTLNNRCISEIKDKKTIVISGGKSNQETYTYDYVGDEDCQQDEIFKVAARPIVDQCLLGYNGTILAYGQTGSGKTHTILGDSKSYEVLNNQDENAMNIDQISSNLSQSLLSSQFSNLNGGIPALNKNEAGILPRSFEYLFQQIQRIKNQYQSKAEKGKRSARKSMAPSHINLPSFNEKCERVEFDVKCQFLEIYNENIYDLLDTSIDKRLNIRQDQDKGIYAEGGREEVVHNLQDVMALVVLGNRNRSVASTQMNRHSSRSHAVFITNLKTIEYLDNGKQNAKISRFYIVDLAGSERCKDTGAEGIRLKEASNINKSLSVLGNVINKLADNARLGDTKPKSHVNYRDSKLTYLLQDSLGGNSKTVMICNVNPHIQAMKETKNSLQFAQRAKMVQNKAVINEDTNCVEFWKNKCQLLERQFSRTGGNNQSFSKANTHSKFNDQSLNDSDYLCYKCQGSNTKSIKNQDQGDYEKMNVDHLKTIKELGNQLKELRDKASEDDIETKKAIDSALTFSNKAKLQINLVNNRYNKLKAELDRFSERNNQSNLAQNNNEFQNSEFEAEINCLKIIIDQQQQEIDFLKSNVESNPLLALKSCQVIDLEKRLKEYQEMYGVEKDQSIDRKINQILDDINGLIARSENLYNSKRIDRQNQDNSSIDIEMIDTSTTRPNQFHNQQQYSQIFDTTLLNSRRDQDLANIKIQYEDQLETLRGQLKSEQEKCLKLKNFLTNQNAAASQCTFGDEMLHSSQISGLFQNNRGQSMLMESQRIPQSQQLQSSQIQNPFLQTMHLPPSCQTQGGFLGQDEIIQEAENDSSQQKSCFQQIDIAEYEKILNDCTLELNKIEQEKYELNQMNNDLTLELQDIRAKYDALASQNIILETEKFQVYQKIEEISQDLEQLTLENNEIQNLKCQLETLEKDNHDLQVELETAKTELASATSTCEYYLSDTFPMLQRELASVGNEYALLQKEHEQLKALQENNPGMSELQSKISHLQNCLAEKEQDLEKLTQALEKSMASIDEQKNYIQNINQSYQAMDKENQELKDQISMSNEIIDESEKSLQVSEKQIQRLEKELSIRDSNYKLEEQKFKEKLKDANTRISSLDQSCRELRNEIEHFKSENQQLTASLKEKEKELTDTRAKYVTYKEMTVKQMDQMEETYKTITKYRSSQVTKTETNEQLIVKYRNEIEQLKDYLRKKELEIQGKEKKLQSLEEFRLRLIEKDKELKRVHDLEKEVSNLRTELKICDTKCQQIESSYLLKENEHKKLQEQYDKLDKEFMNLSKLGDTAKYQHLNKVRGQNNQYAKDLTVLNQEMKNMKLESQNMVKTIIDFTQDVLKTLRIDNVGGYTNKNIIKINPETNLRGYMKELLDIINQGVHNLQLHLHTPMNVSTLKLSQDEDASNSNSEESSNQYNDRQNEIQQMQPPHQNYQSNPHQQQQNPNSHSQVYRGTSNSDNMRTQQQIQQQQQFRGQPMTNKNINLQALQQQQQYPQKQQNFEEPSRSDKQFVSGPDLSKENQIQASNKAAMALQNQNSNQKPMGAKFNPNLQEVGQATYQVQVPISNKFGSNTQGVNSNQQQMLQQRNLMNQQNPSLNQAPGQQQMQQKRPIQNSQFVVPNQSQQQQPRGFPQSSNNIPSHQQQATDINFNPPRNSNGGIDFVAGMQQAQQRGLQQQQQRPQQQQNRNNQGPQQQQPQMNRQPSNTNINGNNKREPSNSRMDIC